MNATGPTGAYVGVPAWVVKPPELVGVEAVTVNGVKIVGEGMTLAPAEDTSAVLMLGTAEDANTEMRLGITEAITVEVEMTFEEDATAEVAPALIEAGTEAEAVNMVRFKS